MEHWAGEGLEKMGVGMVFYSPLSQPIYCL